jgi:DDE superfamily endonuclease
VQRPVATRPWALPILGALDRPPEGGGVHGTRHQPPAHLVRLLLARLMRWFPERHFSFVGDSGYGTSETARFCQKHRQHLTLGSKLPGAAALYEPPPPRTRHTMGRPRVQGPKLASPREGVATTAKRTRLTVAWYGGTTRDSEVVTGTGHWYRLGADLVAVRWGYVPAGTGTHRDAYFLTTDLTMKPQPMVERYTPRWSIETTFQECREHLTLASTKSYGQHSVLRFTPRWFGLSTRVVLL